MEFATKNVKGVKAKQKAISGGFTDNFKISHEILFNCCG